MSRKIAIIGGGIAGLSTGCYGRMNGYDTEIFEMHTLPGGVCTGWVRKGYTFDGCLHWLSGSAPGTPLYQVWSELGALRGKRVIDHEAFCRYVTPSGHHVTQWGDIDRFVEELKGLGPEDADTLERLRADVKLFGTLRQPLDRTGPRGPLGMLRMLKAIKPYLPMFKHYGPMGVEEFTARLKSPALRELFPLLIPLPEFPMFYVLGLLSMLHKKEAGWPEGGSLALARSIERRYLELGGRIRYGARVKEILVEKGRAVGVRLADGSVHGADEVISAADGHATLFNMLGGRYLSPQLRRQYETLPLYTPFVQVSLGLRRDLSAEARLTTHGLAVPVKLGGTEVSWLFVNNYGFDPTMAPPGKAALTVLFWSGYDHWEALARDRKRYEEEKNHVARDTIGWLATIYPGIEAEIEVTDVATPMTTVRYTGNWRASYEGWRPTVKTMKVKMQKTLPGLKNFSMVGQWTAPFAGLPTAALDGRQAIKALCRKERRPFVTTTAAGEGTCEPRLPGSGSTVSPAA
jgi:phytoene dehydrogenase-like protein